MEVLVICEDLVGDQVVVIDAAKLSSRDTDPPKRSSYAVVRSSDCSLSMDGLRRASCDCDENK